MTRSEKLWLFMSQFLNMLAGGDPDESFSARVFREGRTKWISRIDRLLGDKHCYRVFSQQRLRQRNR